MEPEVLDDLVKPVVYVLHGDDDFAVTTFINKMLQRMGDPTTADMNTTRLDGRVARLDEIRQAALTIPFLAERRLVILDNALHGFKDKESQSKLTRFLDELPNSAAIVLAIPDHARFRRGEKTWETLTGKHWLRKWIKSAGKRCYYLDCSLPDQKTMPGWIQQKAKELGGKFDRGAALALAGHVDNDTRLASMEIEKLLTFVNFKRTVEQEDVDLLTAASGQLNIFDMVDAVAQGQKQKALSTLHGLLENQDGFSIFPMIIRQFRLLLQAREIVDEGGREEDIQRELKQISFVARKLYKQVLRFSMTDLENIYHRLLDIEEGVKTGKISIDLALDLFVAELVV
ncbi:MAG: DNA polymerase III subunit delta [Anaerolineaceae bacterium]|nr:DNA polymerase III subunit delta [Anaerolineaceae bacterium]